MPVDLSKTERARKAGALGWIGDSGFDGAIRIYKTASLARLGTNSDIAREVEIHLTGNER